MQSKTTFDFDREYLWNAYSYRKVVNGVIKQRPS